MIVYWAIVYDSLAFVVLSLIEIRQVTNELLPQHKDYLLQFKYHGV